MTNNKIKQIIKELKEKKLDGIICVDMLGEGFDFPNLKIAAIHKPHKSLSSTLQFIGRFARTNAENIAEAKFVAINNEELWIENKQLFIDDAIWQEVIIDLSEGKSKEVEEEKEYLSNFSSGISGKEFNDEDFSLHSLRPNCHAKVFKASNFKIESKFPEQMNIKFGPFINIEDNTVVAIGEEFKRPKWAISDDVLDIEYLLYIVHFQKSTGLLFVYSKMKTDDVYEAIASAFCDNYLKISKSSMHRVLGGLSEFEIFNSGMANKYGSGESYRISAGSDVSEAIDASTGMMFEAGHAFCKAKSNEETLTIGYSSGSKMWSSSYLPVYQFVKWCDSNGEKLNNSSLSVKTNTNFDFLKIPQPMKYYPNNIFRFDFNENTYLSPAVLYIGHDSLIFTVLDLDISIIEVKKDYIELEVLFQSSKEIISCNVNGKFHSENKSIMVKNRNDVMSLVDYLNTYPLVFYTTTDDRISEGEISQGSIDRSYFDPKVIRNIDWEGFNTDIRKEFFKSDVERKAFKDKNSLQDTVKEILELDSNNKYIIFDHGTGEMADFLAVKLDKDSIIISFYHIKSMKGANFNSDVGDIYEVTSQAIKSLVWMKNSNLLLNKIKQRRKSDHCVFIAGDFLEFCKDIKGINRRLRCEIVIVQPAVSNSINIPEKYQDVLASASVYFRSHGKVSNFEIWGS